MPSLESQLKRLEVSAAPFAALRVPGSWVVLDSHDRPLTMLVILEGRAELATVQGDTLPMAQGSLALVPGALCRVRDAGDASAPLLRLAYAGVRAQLRDGRDLFTAGDPIVVDIGGSDLFHTVAGELLAESASTQAGAAIIVDCITKRLVTAVLRQHQPQSVRAPTGLLDQRHGHRLARAVDSMLDQPARGHTVESLADIAGMSRTSFHQSFLRAYGMSPIAFLRHLRLRKAEELLRHTDQPIKSISAQLGYRSRSYFWQAFKNAYGIDPSTYRGLTAR